MSLHVVNTKKGINLDDLHFCCKRIGVLRDLQTLMALLSIIRTDIEK